MQSQRQRVHQDLEEADKARRPALSANDQHLPDRCQCHVDGAREKQEQQFKDHGDLLV
jgi:hypothetical protein